MCLDTLQLGAHTRVFRNSRAARSGGRSPPPRFLLNLVPARFGRTMEVSNVWYDRLVAAAQKPNRSERLAALHAVAQEADATTRDHGPVRAVVISSTWAVRIFLPALDKVQGKADEAYTQRLLSQVAMALGAHKSEHGAYPATLDALKPAYLPEIPRDPFTNKPLTYRLIGEGYLLYSVGPNLKDDAGEYQSTGASTRPDDLTVSVPPRPTTAPSRNEGVGFVP